MNSIEVPSAAFSVLMSVYYKEKAEYLRRALESIINQTLMPQEIILVEDGPLTNELYSEIDEFMSSHPKLFNIVKLEKNSGLGIALREGVIHSSNDIIARMDSDDISLPNRFELQYNFLMSHPKVGIVGGICTEFFDEETKIVYKSTMPLEHKDIVNGMKRKCAISHVSVMFKKEAVLKAGNYRDFYCDEDYDLWVRMIHDGCIFANLPDVLVNVRSGRDQYGRRGSKRYFESEKKVQKYMLDKNMIGLPQYVYNVMGRYIVQVAMPSWMRGVFYKTFLRKK